MSTDDYSPEEKHTLLGIARRALETIGTEAARPSVHLETLPERLREKRGCFVTLMEYGDLRGCTGTIFPRRPLAEEVSLTTIATALDDPRFNPVTAREVPNIQIEISVLSPLRQLVFSSPEDLLRQLRPGIDGVLLNVGYQRATYLPQVWERFPDAVEFLTSLCHKAGLPGSAWRDRNLEVAVYQAIHFEEDRPGGTG